MRIINRFGISKALLLIAFLAAPASSQVASPAGEQVDYFFGEARVTSTTGQYYGSTLSLVKRTIKPAEKKIIEQVVFLDSRKPTEEYFTTLDINGTKFTVKEDKGSFAGEGELTGKPWEWTGWKSEVKLAEGRGSLKSEDTLTKDGIVAKKWFYGPDGKMTVVINEDLRRISKEAFEILRAKLLQK